MADKIRILHVEDNPIVAKLVQEMILTSDGASYQIEHFPLLKPAIERLSRGGLDLILTDLQLPDSDGINTFQRIQAVVTDIPIIIMTGTYEEEELAVQALKQGAQDYLRKSEVNPNSLLRSVRYSIERQHTKNELKEAYSDLLEAQEKLIQSEKLAGLARFSEGVAHEIRNPLGIIIGGSELLEKKLSGAEEDIKTAVGMIKNAALRASDILKSFLVYAKSSSKTAERSDLCAITRDVTGLFKARSASPDVAINTEIPKEGIYVEVDKEQIAEAISHILNNSLEAITGRGAITIKTYKVPMPGSPDAGAAGIVQIDDTGAGISAENMPKLFEPFFTTRTRTIGKGRGLFTAKTIVESFGGTITIDSVQGKGTSVRIALPCRD